MYELILSEKFQKQLGKIIKKDRKVKSRISKALKIIILDPDHPSLRTHKLSGHENWSISTSKSIRIIAHIEDNKIYLLRIGAHDEIYRI